jgi:hypothetical protein
MKGGPTNNAIANISSFTEGVANTITQTGFSGIISSIIKRIESGTSDTLDTAASCMGIVDLMTLRPGLVNDKLSPDLFRLANATENRELICAIEDNADKFDVLNAMRQAGVPAPEVAMSFTNYMDSGYISMYAREIQKSNHAYNRYEHVNALENILSRNPKLLDDVSIEAVEEISKDHPALQNLVKEYKESSKPDNTP